MSNLRTDDSPGGARPVGGHEADGPAGSADAGEPQPAASAHVPRRAQGAARARRGLAIYFAVLVPGSGVIEALLLHAGSSISEHMWLTGMLMWVPAVASLVARGVLREGVGDVSFRWGGRRGWWAVAAAVAMPVAVGGAAYGTAWGLGLVGWRTLPHGGFFHYLALELTVGIAFSSLFAAGEEIGWRGYMLTRLVDGGVPRPLLASGLIWAAWHMPLILSGQYASGPHPALSAALFAVTVVGGALFVGVLRLWSGSVWPAVVMHAAWNSVIQGPFDAAAAGPGAAVWVGESGILVGAATLAAGIATVVFARRTGAGTCLDWQSRGTARWRNGDGARSPGLDHQM